MEEVIRRASADSFETKSEPVKVIRTLSSRVVGAPLQMAEPWVSVSISSEDSSSTRMNDSTASGLTPPVTRRQRDTVYREADYDRVEAL